MSKERSPGGSPIIRHTQAAPPSDTVAHADDERLGAHLARTVGDHGFVWHEILSDRIHVDVHAVPPSAEHPYWVLVTSGMSALPMNVPDEVENREDWLYAEIAMLLPASWKMENEAFKDERNYWPIRLLKELARLPHDWNTWLGWGHSIPNGNPAKPYARGTKLTGAVLVPPVGLGEDFFVVPGEPVIHIFQVLPVTSSEMDLKLRVGLDAMLEHLEKHVPDLYGPIDPGRASAPRMR